MENKFNIEVVINDYQADDGEQTCLFEDIAGICVMGHLFVVSFANGGMTGIQSSEIISFRKFVAPQQ